MKTVMTGFIKWTGTLFSDKPLTIFLPTIRITNQKDFAHPGSAYWTISSIILTTPIKVQPHYLLHKTTKNYSNLELRTDSCCS